MKKTPLLVVADTYYPKVDGVLRFMEEFIRRTKDYFDLSLLVPQFEQYKNKDKLKIYWLETSSYFRMFSYPSIKLSSKNRKTIRDAVKNSKVVFIQEFGPTGVLALHYARKYDKKIVAYVHNTPWEFISTYFHLNSIVSRIIKKMFLHFYKKTDLLFVPYKELQTSLQEEGLENKIEVARLGVDIELYKPVSEKKEIKLKLGLPLDRKIIGYVGRISKEKNISVLLEAFTKLPDNHHLLLVLVGDGPQKQKQEFTELSNCKITGFVKNVEEYLQAMDIFVMPSLTETTSLATLEAMSSGLPVIVTKVGFMQRYITKDYNGIFFAKNNATMLNLKLEKLLKNKKLCSYLGQNARKTVAYSFSWERSINKIKRILSSLAYQQKDI